MKRAWSKMSRVISALLVLGMFASVVPAQALAVEEETTAVAEQQGEEQTEEPAVEEQETIEEVPQGEKNTPTALKDEAVDQLSLEDLFGLYEIVNRSEEVDVRYVFSYSKDFEKKVETLGKDDSFWRLFCPLDGTSAIMFFFTVPEGYDYNVEFSKDAKGDVRTLDNLPATPGTTAFTYDFSEDIAQAKKDGYTHGFFYADWAKFIGQERWFNIELTPIEYDITYNLNSGTVSDKTPNPETYTVESETITLNNPERDGYTFAGWTQDDVTTEPVQEMKIKNGTTGNLSFTAHWNVDISLNFDDVEDETVILKGYTGKAVDETKVPDTKREGYIFNGWYDENGENVEALPTVFPNENVTYIASYDEDFNHNNIPDKDETYTVTYEAEENGRVTRDEDIVCIQGVEGINGSEAVADTGYIVDGWYKGDVKVTGGAVLTPAMVEEYLDTDGNGLYVGTTFTARFVKQEVPAALASYTVRYLEDGTGYEVASPKTVSGVTVGTTVTETAPDIAGYTVTSDKNPQSKTIVAGENIITFYYKSVGPDQPAVVTPSETPAAVAPVTPVIPRTTTTTTTTVTTPTATPAPDAGDAEEEEEEAEEEEVIEEEETPLTEEPAEEETITDEETPLAESASGWALLNLILAIVTVIGAVVLVIGYFAGYQTIWRLLSLIPAIGGVVAFFLTEDMSLPMAFVDSWTVLMVIIAVVQVVIAIMAMKDKEDDEEA